MVRSESRSPRGAVVVIWAALLSGGLALFLVRITHEGLWLDEAYSVAYAGHSFAEIWHLTGSHDIHPPLYYSLVRMFTLVLGDSLFVLRLPSALGVLALAALGAGPVRRACDPTTGVLFAYLVLITPVATVLAQDARMYAWAAFFVTGCAAYGYLATAGSKTGDWIKFGVFALAAAYSHYYALLAVVLIGALLLVRLLLAGGAKLRTFLLTAGAVFLCYLPWLVNLPRQAARVVQGFWIPELTWDAIRHILVYPYDYKFGFPTIPVASQLAFLLVVTLGLFGLVMAILKLPAGPKLVILSACVCLVTMLAGLAVSYIIRPLLIPRYMHPLLGLCVLPAAYGVSLLRNRWLIASVCALLLGLSFPQIVQIQQHKYNGPMPDLTAYLEANVGPDDILLHVSNHSAGPLSYYLPNHPHFIYRPHATETRTHPIFSRNVMEGPDVDVFLEGHDKVWLVGCENLGKCEVADSWVAAGALKPLGPVQEFREPLSWFVVRLWRVKQEELLTDS